jgi:DNA replication protein DnaC
VFDRIWQKSTPRRYHHLGPSFFGDQINSYIRSFVASYFDPEDEVPNSLMFLGTYGVGKTAAMYYIMHWILSILWKYRPGGQQGCGVEKQVGEDEESMVSFGSQWLFSTSRLLFTKHAHLVSLLREEKSEDSGRISRTIKPFDERLVLMVDDLGRSYLDKSGWNLSLEDEYWDWRWENRLPFCATSNMTVDEFRSVPGYERVADRILDPAWTKTVIFTGESKRRSKFVKSIKGAE